MLKAHFNGGGTANVIRMEQEKIVLELKTSEGCQDTCCAGFIERVSKVARDHPQLVQFDESLNKATVSYFQGNHHIGGWLKWEKLTEEQVGIGLSLVFFGQGRRHDVQVWNAPPS